MCAKPRGIGGYFLEDVIENMNILYRQLSFGNENLFSFRSARLPMSKANYNFFTEHLSRNTIVNNKKSSADILDCYTPLCVKGARCKLFLNSHVLAKKN